MGGPGFLAPPPPPPGFAYVSMSVPFYDYLDVMNLKKMDKKMIWCFSIFMIVAFIAAGAGVAIAVGNSTKYFTLEKKFRG